MGRIFFVAAAPDFVYGRVTPELRGNLVSGSDKTPQNWSGEPPFISSATTPMGREDDCLLRSGSHSIAALIETITDSV
jgi:hypothetical protein